MPAELVRFVRAVEAMNRAVGRAGMYLLFALMAVMVWGALGRAVWVPPVWTDETGQFLFMAYFMLGGAWALQQGSAVRMDVFYAAWSPRTRAAVDCVTIFALLAYLGVLLWGGVESTAYALEYGERKPGLWRPPMAPIKVVMVAGIVLMLLQCLCFLLRDIAVLRGRPIPDAG